MGKKDHPVQMLIITGLSGAGKTQVANCLEDIGYYCVDNLPPVLIRKFLELGLHSQKGVKGVALVLDVRGGDFFLDITRSLNEVQKEKIQFEIIFMEASDDVLVTRFKESRRRHPLYKGSVLEAIQSERNMLVELRSRAHIIIDTSKLSVRKLNEKIKDLYSVSQADGFIVNIISFGYKFGIPMDADIVIDVRFLPNPFYDPKMKPMTGEDREVIEYVLGSHTTQTFLRYFLDLFEFLIPSYIKEGKTYLSIAVGCTGGQHRSVVIARYCGDEFKKMGYNTIIRHRDVLKHAAKNGED
ncbi:MAG: RNase adapter RapZ [Syntrophomonadaceae bacterium]|nr:RNase adapter RapZ [Syntrophomonadaceae bacterium]